MTGGSHGLSKVLSQHLPEKLRTTTTYRGQSIAWLRYKLDVSQRFKNNWESVSDESFEL